MNTFTITLSESQFKALSYVAIDPQEWINNVVYERCRLAMQEIFQQETERMLNDPSIENIPADIETVVLAASVKSAAQRNAELMEAL